MFTGFIFQGGLILHVCQYVFQNHVKSRKYTCVLHRYDYTHDQLNTFFLNFLISRGGGTGDLPPPPIYDFTVYLFRLFQNIANQF